ncbi:hypothetical protein SAMN00808754_0208 [Thermanaeromonas toyohensis ToBE]|uniref:Energy-coupling factor transport system substrate-specific component n=1 Tax=Thermanaeromonas toyohensis ToBE TaxID=698762 RepID=A0A1W1V8L1_9FIRM|nr:hypothetical protein [Thermanaeromonas toyohensis]SMB89769.1 hypothetical protein SAMN00808754_0208 [Thermanaeromonas toyohensis ToBE]
MTEFLKSLLSSLGSIGRSIGFQTMNVIGTFLLVIMTLILIGEMFNYQVVLTPWPRLVKRQRRWNTKSIAVMGMTAALSVILQAVGAVIVLVPGTITFRADAMVRFPFGAIFGMPAVWGVGLANLLGDALAGTLGPGSIGGAVISWWMPYLFYRLMRQPEERNMIKGSAWFKYYAISLLWCLIGSFYLCSSFQWLRLLPTEVIWVGVFPAVIVTTFIGGLAGPLVARIVGPAADKYGLSLDKMRFEVESEYNS